jgi:hypothetical protein
MTKREVIKLVLDKKRPPYVPWNIGLTKEAQEKLRLQLVNLTLRLRSGQVWKMRYKTTFSGWGATSVFSQTSGHISALAG